VVAARLSEDPSRQVLLLEAGRTFSSAAEFPAELLGRDESAWVGADYNWKLAVSLTRERPQPVQVTRGRVIGGSSTVNGGIHLRALPEDFTGWGDGLWDWPDVLRCYRACETDVDFGTDPAHGDHGPVPVRRARRSEYSRLYAAFDDAARRAGHPDCPDLNHPDRCGIGPLPRNFTDGRRANAAVAYLMPVLGRPNLEVRATAVVDRVLVEDGRVVGVAVPEAGSIVRYQAPSVVLCAGALMTPAVLLRSGIGPAGEVARFDRPVLADLPGVGAVLRDHPTVHVQAPPRSAEVFPAAGAPGRMQAALCFTAPGSADRNDLQIMPTYRGGMLALTVMLNHSLSTGSVRLATTDPCGSPLISLNYLSHPADLARLRAGVEEARRLMCSPSLAGLTARDDAVQLPVTRDTAGADSWIRDNVSTAAHSHGTCPMGGPDDGGVVDARGRVHGVDGLAIADLSILPVPLRNNTHATSLMLGERFAELYAATVPVPAGPFRG
jgi:choline dehydrogenase